MDPQTIGNVLLIATCIIYTLCVAVYARVPWWRDAVGANAMALTAAIALLTGLGVARLIVGDPPWFTWVRVSVFVAVPLIGLWRFILIVTEQRGGGD